MAKQEKLDFDYEEYFNEQFETTAVLMWNTHHAPFTFASYFNKLYNKQLERKDNITIHRKSGELICSVYLYQSNIKHMVFILIDSGNYKSPSHFFDKTMLIVGEGAYEEASAIYRDMNKNPENYDDYMMQEREDMRQRFLNSGVLESAMFDFSNPDYPNTTYFPKQKLSAAMEKKRQRFLKEQREFVIDLLMAVDELLPDFDQIDC